MQVYRNILVTMDCSPVDDAIIQHISRVALQNEATLHLLHVVHSHTLDEDRALRERCEAALGTHIEQLRTRGIDARMVIRSGEPDREVLKEIDVGEYDLVAMATHGHSLIGSILFGSVSRSLKQNIRIPLLLLTSS
jgi:universal stress protein A